MTTTTRWLMDATRFQSGLSFTDFVKGMDQNQKRIKQMFDKYTLTEADTASLEQAVKLHGGRLYISILVEDWCPDVSLNVPVFQHIAEQTEGVELRLFVRSENKDLQDAYRAEEIYAIPTVTIFNANWEIIGHWVERSQLAHQQINQWVADNHPDYNQLKKSDNPADKELAQKISASRFATMLKWYRDGLWRETLTEIIDILN